MSTIVHVAVAVIVNQKQEVCISLRHADAHQGGLWEFPGGKIESGEQAVQALKREIKEELTLNIVSARPLITIHHQYKDEDEDRGVCLQVFKVLDFTGQAQGMEGQPVKWIALSQLSQYDFPAANQAIIKAVQLPDKYLITGKFSNESDFLNRLKAALSSGISLVQLRLKAGDINPECAAGLVEQATSLCRDSGARILLNLADCYSIKTQSSIAYDGIHADSHTLKTIVQRPHCQLFSASCHNADELAKAMQLKADFVVLSPVQKTASHPEMEALGWQAFSELTENCSVPVYALGGVSNKNMEQAWAHGAQGIAAISAYWNSV